MHCRRFLAALTAALPLIVYSGCGGEDKKDSSATGPGKNAQAGAGGTADKTVAGQTAGEGPSGNQTASTDSEPIDVSLVTPEHFAAIAIKLRRITQSPLVAEPLKDEMIAGAIKKFGIDPGEVKQMVILIGISEKQPRRGDPVAVVVVRFTHDVDAKEALTKLQAAMAPGGPSPIAEVMVGGKTCLDLGPGDAPMAYAPNHNTIVLTSKENMGKVVSTIEPKGPLFERLKKADADNDIIVAFEPGAFPDFDKTVDDVKRGAPLNLDPVKRLKGGTATFNLAAPSLVRVVLDTKDAQSAAEVEDMLQQAVRMAGGGLAMAKQGIPKEAQTRLAPLVTLAEECVDGAKTAKSESQAVLDVKRPQILDSGSAPIVGAVEQFVMEQRAAANRAREAINLKQIALAMLSYVDTYRSFPPAQIEKDGKPLLSWRVAILPFLDEVPLHRQFHLDEPWDSPHNLEAAKTVPPVFQSADDPGSGKTRVMLFTGKGAAFDGGKKVQVTDIRDGASNTILCVEAGPDKAAPWTKPEDLPFDPANPLAALGNVSPQGFFAAFFDGHVALLKVDNETLKALITPDGGEVIDPAKLYGGR